MRYATAQRTLIPLHLPLLPLPPLPQVTFIGEQVELTCYEVIEQTLKENFFSDGMVQIWVDEICTKITRELAESNKPFKYIGTGSPLARC